MRIIIEGQSVVSDVMCRIPCFHHGTQCHRLNEFLLFLSLTVVHQCVQRLGNSSFGTRGLHLITKLDHKLTQCFQLCGVRLVMNTIRQSLGFGTLLHPTHTLSNRTVSKQHELFNQLSGIIALLEIGTCGFTLLVNIKMKFLTVEFHSSTLKAALTQFLG